MKRIIFFIACMMLSLTQLSFAKGNPESLDKMVAIVNDDVITRSELDHAIATARMQMASENIPLPASATLEKQVLEQLINKKLQLQVAKQSGLDIGNDEVDRAVNNIAAKNNVTVK